MNLTRIHPMGGPKIGRRRAAVFDVNMDHSLRTAITHLTINLAHADG